MSIPLKNKVREETAKEILNRIDEIYGDGYCDVDLVEGFYIEIREMIRKEYLYLSDYT